MVPVAHHAETEGTFVNRDGLAQRFMAAIPAPEGVRPAWQALAALAGCSGKDRSASSQLAELRKGCRTAGARRTEARV